MFSCGIAYDGNANFLDEPGNATCYHPNGKYESLTINQAYQKAISAASKNITSCITSNTTDRLKKKKVQRIDNSNTGYKDYETLARLEKPHVEKACCVAKEKVFTEQNNCGEYNVPHKTLIFNQIGIEKNEIKESFVTDIDNQPKEKILCPNVGQYDMTCFQGKNNQHFECEFSSDIHFSNSLLAFSGQQRDNKCQKNKRRLHSYRDVIDFSKQMDAAGKKSCIVKALNGTIDFDDAQYICSSEKNIELNSCEADWELIDSTGTKVNGKGRLFHHKNDWDNFNNSKNAYPPPTICLT